MMKKMKQFLALFLTFVLLFNNSHVLTTFADDSIEDNSSSLVEESFVDEQSTDDVEAENEQEEVTSDPQAQKPDQEETEEQTSIDQTTEGQVGTDDQQNDAEQQETTESPDQSDQETEDDQQDGSDQADEPDQSDGQLPTEGQQEQSEPQDTAEDETTENEEVTTEDDSSELDNQEPTDIPEETGEDEKTETLRNYRPSDAIWANDDLYLTGMMPEGAIVEATPVTIEIDGENVIAAYDIKIYADEAQKDAGVDWQPEDKIKVHFFAQETTDDLHVYHMADESSDPELVETVTPEDGWVEFEAESFSIYAITETVLTQTVVASDGQTYEIEVTYSNKAGIPMTGTELVVSELLPGDEGYDSYVREAAIAAGVDNEAIEYAKAFDIRIVDKNDSETIYEPTDDVQVMIRLIGETMESYSNVNVMHFVDDGYSDGLSVYEMKSNAEGEVVKFSTDGFSVYVVIAAPEPYVPGEPVTVQDLTELASNYEDDYGFYLSYGNNNFFTNTLNNKNAFVETTNVSSASQWFFEAVEGVQNRYYIYTMIDGVPQYMRNTSGNEMGLTPTKSSATAFDLSHVSGNTSPFYFKVAGANKWLQHSNSGGGIRLWTDTNDAVNPRITITYASSINAPNDYYELDGKTYGIAYYEESIKGAGLTSTQQQVSGKSRLTAIPLLVRPDVLDSTGELLIAEDTDLTDWTFVSVGGTSYYLTTQIGGTTYYLTLGSSDNLTLETTPNANSIITVESGTGAFSGKYRFTVGSRKLTFVGSTTGNNWFANSTNGAEDKTWLNLVTKSTLLDDDDFTIYSAEKVDLSDRVQVHNGTKVVVYTRTWNEETLKYEFYVVNYDGSLSRAFESGDMIQWIGSTINTMTWDFTEYQDETGNPTYFYQLKNTYPGGGNSNCIRPANDGSFLRTESAYPSTFDRSINLNGRRYGYYYSTILAWDDDSYGYIGLKVKDDRSGVEVCPMNQADSFYFAIMTDTPSADDAELATVDTVDHEMYGITMKMVDLPSRDWMAAYLGSNAGGTGTQLTQGLLSSNLDLVTGYPTVTAYAGKSLKDLYNGETTVNHLFISNTYYSSGYYEYDSTQNFASFYYYDENGDRQYDGENFTVYAQLASYDAGDLNSRKHSQFFPYNYITPGVFAQVNGLNLYDALQQELPDSDPRKGEQLYLIQGPNGVNPQFAMEIEASFTQTVSGLDAWGHDIIYEFTGDDDFWLYVDGELVIDLGGIHSAVAGSVNYRTGDVWVNGVHSTLREVFENNYRTRNPNASDGVVEAYLAQFFDEGETIFKDYTEHTMRIFYMERGAGASNLHMRFNLASVKPGTVELSKVVEGVDSTESFMAEYPFQIFFKGRAEEFGDEPEEHPLIPGQSEGISVLYKDTTREVTYKGQFTAADKSTTYEHVYLLKPGETAVITFPDDSYEYRIVECFVNTNVYDKVFINGDEVTINHADINEDYVDLDSLNYKDVLSEQRADFSSSYEEIAQRGRIIYTNHVDPDAKGTLTFVKHLFEEDGKTPIPHEDSDVTFTFRLYLGTENTIDQDLNLANMYSYHVLDDQDNYCKWVSGTGFVSLGKSNYADLTEAEQAASTFSTSMNGTISNIPVDYTVEIREIPAGTKYKVEEREYEIPDGYTLQWYVPFAEDASTGVIAPDMDLATKTPFSGIIANGLISKVEIRNLKGWGLRVYKEWSDAEWMVDRKSIYFAVYINDGNGNLTLVPDTVKPLAFGEESIYWFFEHLDPSVDGNFSKYEAREVLLSGGDPNVENGIVTNVDSLTIEIKDVGQQVTLSGKQIGDDSAQSYTYTIVSYEIGSLEEHHNVRIDTISNKRHGVELKLTDWNGNALAGGTFNLVDGEGNSVGTFTSDKQGLITIAYLKQGVDYTLTQTGSPTGYLGMETPLTIRLDGTDVIVNGGEDGWWLLDDEDINTGDNIRYGLITIKNKKYTLKIKKTAQTADGSPIPGVIFALYHQVMGNNNQPRKDYRPIDGYDNLVTDADGLVPIITDAFANGTLLPGTYYLYERESVEGFSPLSGDVIFTVSEMGVVTVHDASPYGVGVESDSTQNEGIVDYTLFVPNQPFGTVELDVTKIVENATTADLNGTNKFIFTAKLYLPDGLTPWDYNEGGFPNGTASFSLGHGETRKFIVPLNAIVTVVETAKEAYTTNAALQAAIQGHTTTSTLSYNSDNLTSTVQIKDTENLTLTYENTRKTVTVTVKKTVVGSGGEFFFTADLKDGTTACENWTLNTNGTVDNTSDDIITGDGTGGTTAGQARFSLTVAANTSATIVLTIPYGTTLTITEDSYSNYRTKVGNDQTSEWTRTGITSNQSVTFTNTELSISPSGVNMISKPFIWIFLAGILLLAVRVMTVYLKKRRREDETG